MTKLYQLFVLLIIIILALARVIAIDRIPPATFIDEFNLAEPAAQIALGNISIPWNGFGWYATPGLFFYYVAFLFRLFGISIHIIKLAWIIPAIISLPLVYQLGNKLFSSKFVGLASLILYGFNVISVHIARWGHGSVITAMFQLLSLLFLWMSVESKNWKRNLYLMSAACVMGLSLYFYVGARSYVLLFPLYIFWYWVYSKQKLQKKIIGSLLFIAVIFLVAFPIVIEMQKDPFNFIWRIKEVSIIQSDLSLSSNMDALTKNGIIYLRIFYDAIDENLRHNPLQSTLFPYYLGLLIPASIVILCIKKSTRKQGLFLLLGLVATLAGGVLSTEAPSYFRIFGAIPIMAICIAAIIYSVSFSSGIIKRFKINLNYLKISLLLLISSSTTLLFIQYLFFMLQPSPSLLQAFSYPEQIIAQTAIKYREFGNQVYLSTDYLYSSTRFLALPKQANLEFRMFDIDALLDIDEPATLILESSAVGLQSYLEEYFTIVNFFELETGQESRPIVYELLPKRPPSEFVGLSVTCDNGQMQLLQKRSLGIYHSLQTFPENIMNCSWKGQITITEIGEYSLKGSADDSVSLQLASSSGEIIFSQQPEKNWVQTAILESGSYELLVTYQNLGGARNVRVEWLKPGSSIYEVIDPLLLTKNQTNE
ncbi:glycosyltransferase family 39 protein [Candidatus Woesebacteria bacterium]|nr:glycosyltransferase family 39 protein [Candidatus Woesebacteria bacterium]